MHIGPDRRLVIAIAVMVAVGCSGDDPASSADSSASRASATAPDSSRAAGDGSTRVLMRRVAFHMPHDIVLDIEHLSGAMAPVSPDRPISFDDVESFELTMETAEIAIGMDALAVLMNDWVFAFEDAPLRDFSFETDDEGRLVMTGKLDRIIDVGFEIEADVELMPSGEIRARPHDIDVLGFIGGGFLDRIGLSLEDVVDTEKAVGVRVDGNDLYLDPLRILPPPRMTGTITQFRIEPGRLVQVFGDTAGAGVPDATAPARNFMRFDGGTLTFGKLTMSDAILVVMDQEPADPFDFSIVEYTAQLVAGYSRTRSDLGMNVWMPDLDDVRRGSVTTRAPELDMPVRDVTRAGAERDRRLHRDNGHPHLGGHVESIRERGRGWGAGPAVQPAGARFAVLSGSGRVGADRGRQPRRHARRRIGHRLPLGRPGAEGPHPGDPEAGRGTGRPPHGTAGSTIPPRRHLKPVSLRSSGVGDGSDRPHLFAAPRTDAGT